jgi:hypothetical protein
MHFHRRTEHTPGGLGEIILAAASQVTHGTCELTVER